MIPSDNPLNNGLISMLSGLLKDSPELIDQPGDFADRLAAALAGSDDESQLLDSLRTWVPEVLPDGPIANSVQVEAPMEDPEAPVSPDIFERLRELLAASRFRQPGEDGEIMPLAQSAQLHSAASVELSAQAAAVAAGSPRELLAQTAATEQTGRAPVLDTLSAQPNTLSHALSAQLQPSGQDESRSFDPNQSRFSELLNARADSGLKNEPPAALRSILLENSPTREVRAPEAPTAAIAASTTESQRPPAASADVQRLPVPAGQPQFSNALGEQVRMMVSRGVGQAVIRLDPPHLGSLEIRMRTEGDHTKVQFIAQTPAAREALEQALPRLRELFADQGQRIEASVSERDQRANQQAGNQAGGDGEAEAPPDPKYRLSDSEAEAEGGVGDDATLRSGLLDAYA